MKSTKRKSLLLVSIASLATISVTATVLATTGLDYDRLTATDATYDVVFNGTNGAATTETLKTTIGEAKTNLQNDVKVVYKNVAALDGKVGRVNAKGYYGNFDPIYAMNRIVVDSNATLGDAKLIYGKTSNCIDGEVDLATKTIEVENANYFKIVATNPIEVNAINITFACDNSDTGFEAIFEEQDNRSKYEFVLNGGTYAFRVVSANSNHYVNKLVIPDYYNGADGYLPVTKLLEKSNYGVFEKANNVQEVHLPETITQFGSYFWAGTHNYIKEFTFPRELTTVSTSGRLVPSSTSLTTLYYNSRNLSYTGSSAVNKSYQPNLKDIYVSYDVESLPYKFIDSIPDGLKIHYEGTEAEWAALTASAASWNYGDVYCADTVVATATFHYADSTLNDDASGTYAVEAKVGKPLADPGRPVWTGEGSKVFLGWFTAAEGGEQVTFPYNVTGNVDFYAQFGDKPSGYRVDDPKDITLGTTQLVTTDDLGNTMYLKYTSQEDDTVLFYTSDVNCTNNNYPSTKFKLYEVDGTEATYPTSGSNSAKESVKEVALLKSGPDYVKIHFAAGKSYILAYSIKDFGAYYGTATLHAESVKAAHGDYRYAAPYTVGEEATLVDIAQVGHYWQTFEVSEANAGKYTFDFNSGDKTANCQTAVGRIKEDGTWEELVAGNYSVGTKFVDLTAGTYYIASTANNATGTYHFKLTKGTPAGESFENPLTLTLGEDVTVKYTAYAPICYTFNVANAGVYKLTASKAIYLQENVSNWNNSYAYVHLTQDPTFAAENLVLSGARLADDSTGSKDVLVELNAGTYYLKLAAYSTAYTFKISEVANPEGTSVAYAKTLNITAETTHVDVADTTGNGTVYKFVAPTNQFYQFKTNEAGTVKLGYKQNSAIQGYSNFVTLSNGEMHKKLTEGEEYYIVVKGEVTGLDLVLTDTFEDGASYETAYSYTLGTKEERAKSSSTRVYFKFVAPSDGDYIVTKSATYQSYFGMVNSNENTVSGKSGSTSYEMVYALTGGEQYYCYAYSIDFTIEKAAEGYSKDSAIAITVAATDTTVELTNLMSSGTWYAFTADMDGFFEVTTASELTAAFYVGNASSPNATVSSAAKGVFAVALNDVVYIKVTGTTNVVGTFAIAHPTSVQDGKTAKTAFVMEGNSFELTNTKANLEYFYIKVAVTPNTDYIVYNVSATGDFDLTGIYGADGTTSIVITKNIDTSATKTVTLSDNSTVVVRDHSGSTNNNDFSGSLNSGDNEFIYIYARQYTSGTLTTTIYCKTAADFVA